MYPKMTGNSAWLADKFRITTDVYLVGDRLAYDQKEDHRLGYCLVICYIFNRNLTLLTTSLTKITRVQPGCAGPVFTGE